MIPARGLPDVLDMIKAGYDSSCLVKLEVDPHNTTCDSASTTNERNKNRRSRPSLYARDVVLFTECTGGS